jgi:hypothetical protein
MKKTMLFVLVALMVTLFSCNETEKPTDVKITKDLSLTIDATYTFEYTPTSVLRHETTSVYDVNKQLVKIINRVDTFPPSTTSVRDTLSYTKNDEERDTIVTHLKEYQTYIKVDKK